MDLLYLNQVAQGVHSMDDLVSLIREHGADAGRDVVWRISFMADQAGATAEDASPAIANAGINSDFSPSWLPSGGPFRIPIDTSKIADDQIASELRFLISLYTIADNRRRVECGAPNCQHWWHQDLGDPDTLNEVRRHLKRHGA